MTTEPGVEMTIDQIVQVTRSKYFVAAFRVSVFVFTVLGSATIGVVTWAVFDTRSKADAAVVVSADVAKLQAAKAQDNDRFQTDIISKVDDLSKEMDQVHNTQLKMSESVGRIEGMLEFMRAPTPAARHVPVSSELEIP